MSLLPPSCSPDFARFQRLVFRLLLFPVELAVGFVVDPILTLARGAAVRHDPATRTRLEWHAFLFGLGLALAAQNYLVRWWWLLWWFSLLRHGLMFALAWAWA